PILLQLSIHMVGFWAEQDGSRGCTNMLSPDEAERKALSSEFREFVKSRGLAGELKSLLRTRLVQEIRRRDGKTKENRAIDMSLRTKALISLIGDYLKRTSKDLSLSVLLPDYGLSTSDILS
ncbi:oxidative DNA demethylase, partial [Perkinsus olseni]